MVLLLAMLMRGAVAGYVIPVQMDHLPGTVLSMPAESCHDAEGLLPAGDSQKNMTSCQSACDLAFAPAFRGWPLRCRNPQSIDLPFFDVSLMKLPG